MHKKTILILLFFSALFIIILNLSIDDTSELSDQIVLEKKKENIQFGFNLDSFNVRRDTVNKGDVFGSIMLNDLSYPKIYKIAENIKDSFDVRNLREGKPYTILYSTDSLKSPQYFIYQPDRVNYIVIDFSKFDSIFAYSRKKPFKIVKKSTSGVINNSLSETMDQNGLPWELINQLSDVYAWTIDFTRIQKGDKFKIIYQERYIEDTILVGIKKIDAAYFNHSGEELYAFNFLTDSLNGFNEFFDKKGNSLQRTFLKSPLKFSNITSRYNLKRRIAYYGYRVVPHKGTDFAAPKGTPIMATASGKVIKSSYTKGNGYYVKIQHNNQYSTQYLHMQKNGRVKEGDYVRQGHIIGRVGMTGNTSGPHVCYRFWKNGKQVDPYKQKLPPGDPISKENRGAYMTVKDSLMTILNSNI